MSSSTAWSGASPAAVIPIPVRTLLPWLLFVGVLMLAIVYFVTAQQNAWMHEWLHDGRHLLGVPCH
jgi:hypothetical protein